MWEHRISSYIYLHHIYIYIYMHVYTTINKRYLAPARQFRCVQRLPFCVLPVSAARLNPPRHTSLEHHSGSLLTIYQ